MAGNMKSHSHHRRSHRFWAQRDGAVFVVWDRVEKRRVAEYPTFREALTDSSARNRTRGKGAN